MRGRNGVPDEPSSVSIVTTGDTGSRKSSARGPEARQDRLRRDVEALRRYVIAIGLTPKMASLTRLQALVTRVAENSEIRSGIERERHW